MVKWSWIWNMKLSNLHLLLAKSTGDFSRQSYTLATEVACTKSQNMESILQFIDSNLIMIYLLVFTIILGFEVISKVPTVLHTPLMSGANAISGVVIIGAIILIRNAAPDDLLTLSLGTLGVILGMINVVGGYAVTDRMLEMFKKKKKS